VDREASFRPARTLGYRRGGLAGWKRSSNHVKGYPSAIRRVPDPLLPLAIPKTCHSDWY
jgi:hypothetical protein